MSKVNFGENWAILRGAKANKTQSVDFAGAPGASKVNASNVSSTTAGAYKAKGSKGGGEARQKKKREDEAKGLRSQSGGDNLTGPNCIIKEGPNKGGVKPDCKSYNPSLAARPRLPVPTSDKDPVFKQDLYKLMHGDGGYEDTSLTGNSPKIYDKKRALAVLYGMMNQRKKGAGGTYGMTPRQDHVSRHIDSLGKMEHKNRQKALQAIHDTHDQETSAGNSVRDAVHKALIANPSASPEELLQTLKSHESGDLTKNLHPDEIRHIMDSKRFQSDVRNVGWKVKTLLRKNKDATPEDILAALEGNTGSLTDDEIMAIIKNQGYVGVLRNAPKPEQPQAQPQGGANEPAGDANTWIAQNKPVADLIGNQLESLISKGAQSDENEGMFDPSTYEQGDYDNVVANIMAKFPNTDEGMLKKALRDGYGLSSPSDSAPPPAAATAGQTSRPNPRPEGGYEGPLQKPLRDNLNTLKGYGSDRNIQAMHHARANQLLEPQNKWQDQQDKIKAKEQAKADKAAARAQKSGTPGGAPPAEDQAQPDSGGGAPGNEAPAGTPGPETKAPEPGPGPTGAAGPETKAPEPGPGPTGAAGPETKAPEGETGTTETAPNTPFSQTDAFKNSPLANHPVIKAASKFGGANAVNSFIDMMHDFIKSMGGGDTGAANNPPPNAAPQTDDSNPPATKAKSKAAAPRRTRAQIIADKAAANKAKNEAAANKADEEKKGTVKASEQSPAPPHGWQFCESSSSTPLIAQGQDANRNLVKVPEGWSPKVS